MDYLWGSDEGNILLHYGIEGQSYTVDGGKPKLTEWVLDNPDGLDPGSALRTPGAWPLLFDRQTREFMASFFTPQAAAYYAANTEAGLYIDPFPSILATKAESDAFAGMTTEFDTCQKETAGIMNVIFSPSGGVINRMLTGMGITDSPVNFFYEPSAFRPLYIGSEIWQHMGWNSVIYIATLSSIDPQLYEAAQINGAGKWRRLRHVTLPGLRDVIVTLLVLNFDSMMSVGFEKVLLIYKPSTYETGGVISTYIYREGLSGGQLGYSTAVGLFNSAVNFILLIVFNRLSRRIGEVNLW
jgi:hypothetical protein